MNKTLLYFFIASLSILGFFLVTEHRAHILGNAQYLLFALFIAMHFFMHAGHGKGDKTRRRQGGGHEGGHH